MYSVSHAKRLSRILALALAAWALPSAAQQPDDLQKQLQQLKQQYEQTTQELQQRIAALEQQIEKQKETAEKTKAGKVAAAELAGEQAAQKAVLGATDDV